MFALFKYPHADAWVFIQGKERIEIRPKWSFASNNGGALCQAASLGMGIIRSPALSVRRYVQSGELVEILEDYKLPSLSVYATYLQRNYYPAKITTLSIFWWNIFLKNDYTPYLLFVVTQKSALCES